jgi:hypothetical protein
MNHLTMLTLALVAAFAFACAACGSKRQDTVEAAVGATPGPADSEPAPRQAGPAAEMDAASAVGAPSRPADEIAVDVMSHPSGAFVTDEQGRAMGRTPLRLYAQRSPQPMVLTITLDGRATQRSISLDRDQVVTVTLPAPSRDDRGSPAPSTGR